VASPSTVELVAKITSSIFSTLISFKKSSIPRSSGLTPSIGDSLPRSTKYFHL
jgi:hypothetical protein